MAFTAPTLVTSISTQTFRTQINSNFNLIQNALQQIQTELTAGSGTRSVSNISWIERQLKPDGVIGHQSFVPDFDVGSGVFEITHETPSGKSIAILNGATHETNATFSKLMTDIVTSNGTFEVAFGIITRGAPVCEQFLELESTDKAQELTIWTMDVTRSGATVTLANLRRVAPVHMNRDSWGKVLDFEHAITWRRNGLLPLTAGPIDGTGLLIPWNCTVDRAYVRLETPPAMFTDSQDVVIEIDRLRGTDATNILDGQATFTDRDGIGAVKWIFGQSPEQVQLEAGDFVYPNLVTPEQSVNLTDFPQEAGGLSITLLLRRIYDEIYP